MKLSWVDYGTILTGLTFLVVHLVGCVRHKRKPSLPVAVAAISTGCGMFFGAILVLTPFFAKLRELPPRPEYLVIAGVAVLWVSVQYGWSLWSGSATATAESPSEPSKAIHDHVAKELPAIPVVASAKAEAATNKEA